MKKSFLFTLLASILLITIASCNKDITNCIESPANCYKGRLEIKAICGNYTVKVLEGNIDTSLVQESWTDPNTNKSYQNVFRLANPCILPDSVKEGDDFYFQIQNKNEGCFQCKAYYPTPSKSVEIKVTDRACNSRN